MRTMVVDDEVVSRKKMRQIMRNFSLCTDMADGAEAIIAFKQALAGGTPFEIIILDLEMPEMDGIKVLQIIRGIEKEMKISANEKVKVLMATANTEKARFLNAFRLGVIISSLSLLLKSRYTKNCASSGIVYKHHYRSRIK